MGACKNYNKARPQQRELSFPSLCKKFVGFLQTSTAEAQETELMVNINLIQEV